MVGVKSDKPKGDLTLGSATDPNTTIIEREPEAKRAGIDLDTVVLDKAPDRELSVVIDGGQPVSTPEAEFKLLLPEFEDSYNQIVNLGTLWQEIPESIRKRNQENWNRGLERVKVSFLKLQSLCLRMQDKNREEMVSLINLDIDTLRKNLASFLIRALKKLLVIPRKDDPILDPLLVIQEKMGSGREVELQEALDATKVLFGVVYEKDVSLESVFRSTRPDMRGELEVTMQNLDSLLPLVTSTTGLEAEEYLITKEAILPSLQAYIYLYINLVSEESVYRVKNPLQSDYEDGSMMLAIPRTLEVLIQVEMALNILFDNISNKKSQTAVNTLAILSQFSNEINNLRSEISSEDQTDKFIFWVVLVGAVGLLPSIPFMLHYWNSRRRANPVPKGVAEPKVVGIEQYQVTKTAESIYRLRYSRRNPEANYHTRGYKDAYLDAQVLHEMKKAGFDDAIQILSSIRKYEEGSADSARLRFDLSQKLPRMRDVHSRASSRVDGQVSLDVWKRTVYRESAGIGESRAIEKARAEAISVEAPTPPRSPEMIARNQAIMFEMQRLVDSGKYGRVPLGVSARSRAAAESTAVIELAETAWREQYQGRSVDYNCSEWTDQLWEAREKIRLLQIISDAVDTSVIQTQIAEVPGIGQEGLRQVSDHFEKPVVDMMRTYWDALSLAERQQFVALDMAQGFETRPGELPKSLVVLGLENLRASADAARVPRTVGEIDMKKDRERRRGAYRAPDSAEERRGSVGGGGVEGSGEASGRARSLR